jgi:predicted dehydrogenase
MAALSVARAAPRRRYAYVGTGGRVRTFLDPVAGRYADSSEIVGLCDASLVRARYHCARLQSEFGYAPVPVFAAPDFGRMLCETRPDVVVVCTIDCEHDHYIAEALRAGCNVISEKPLTVNAEKCAAILAAVNETGRSIRVAFNYRWSPGATKVRELLAAGTIGAVRHVTMEYLLNTSHGADYFRRWHARKDKSGGLLVHKATHHFDLINWWIDAIPETVFAQGVLAFYGRENAVRRGDGQWANYPRYLGHATAGDPFTYDYSYSMLQDTDYERNLYLGPAEQESGYIRDRNVFRDDITIEDVMNVLVRYRSGALLSYSLNAFSPYEGYRVAFTGDRGRLEYREWHGAHLIGNGAPPPAEPVTVEPELRVFPHFQPSYGVAIRQTGGDHGGGDPLLQQHIFSVPSPADPFRRSAGHEQGAASVLVGIAANRSMAEGRPVNIGQLVALRPEATRLSELV